MGRYDCIFINARFDGGSVNDIGVTDGRIVAITASGGQLPEGVDTIDLGGALIVPGFVEGHIHLDTSFYGDRWFPHIPYTHGFDVSERVSFQAGNMAKAAPRSRPMPESDTPRSCLMGSTRMLRMFRSRPLNICAAANMATPYQAVFADGQMVAVTRPAAMMAIFAKASLRAER